MNSSCHLASAPSYLSTKFLRVVAPATRHRRRDLPPHARLTSDTIENATTPAVTTTAPATAGLIPRTSASATPSCLAADLTIEVNPKLSPSAFASAPLLPAAAAVLECPLPTFPPVLSGLLSSHGFGLLGGFTSGTSSSSSSTGWISPSGAPLFVDAEVSSMPPPLRRVSATHPPGASLRSRGS